jgi:hypothetical protein
VGPDRFRRPSCSDRFRLHRRGCHADRNVCIHTRRSPRVCHCSRYHRTARGRNSRYLPNRNLVRDELPAKAKRPGRHPARRPIHRPPCGDRGRAKRFGRRTSVRVHDGVPSQGQGSRSDRSHCPSRTGLRRPPLLMCHKRLRFPHVEGTKSTIRRLRSVQDIDRPCRD